MKPQTMYEWTNSWDTIGFTQNPNLKKKKKTGMIFKVQLPTWGAWSQRRKTTRLGTPVKLTFLDTLISLYSFRRIWLAAIFQFVCTSSIACHSSVIYYSVNSLNNELQVIGLVYNICILYTPVNSLSSCCREDAMNSQNLRLSLKWEESC